MAEQFLTFNATCKNPDGVDACKLAGGTCNIIVDGFCIEVAISLFIGLIAYLTLLRKMASNLDSLPLNSFRLSQRSSHSFKSIDIRE